MSLAFWTWVFMTIFIVSMILLALYGLRRTKTTVDFATAPRSYGPAVIGIALMATACSAAATMGNPGLVFAYGWPALWYAMGGYAGIAIAWTTSAFALSRNGGSEIHARFHGHPV